VGKESLLGAAKKKKLTDIMRLLLKEVGIRKYIFKSALLTRLCLMGVWIKFGFHWV
jgi:hypothetical protein